MTCNWRPSMRHASVGEASIGFRIASEAFKVHELVAVSGRNAPDPNRARAPGGWKPSAFSARSSRRSDGASRAGRTFVELFDVPRSTLSDWMIGLGCGRLDSSAPAGRPVQGDRAIRLKYRNSHDASQSGSFREAGLQFVNHSSGT